MPSAPTGRIVTGSQAAAVAIAVTIIVFAITFALTYLPHSSPVRLLGPPPGGSGSSTFSGGGGTCPNPSVTVRNAITNPPPPIGWPATEWYYSGGCYHLLVYAPLADGGPLGGALVNVSIWPATGPGSLGSPPPANWTCGPPPPGANGGGCIYVPPPRYFAYGLTGSDGFSAITVGMPAGNYSVGIDDWIDGTTSAGGGSMNATETGSTQPLINTFEPVNYVTGSVHVSIGVFFTNPNGSAAVGYSAAYYVEDPAPGPTHSLGLLTGTYSVFPFTLPSGTGQYAIVVFELLDPHGSVVSSTSLYATYFVTPVL